VLPSRSLCDELITRPEESYGLWCVVLCDLETSRIGAPYIYDISTLRVKSITTQPNTPKDLNLRCSGYLNSSSLERDCSYSINTALFPLCRSVTFIYIRFQVQ